VGPVIGRPIGENHGEQCSSDDPYWWCDSCRAGVIADTPAPEAVRFLIEHTVDNLTPRTPETEQS